MRTRFSFIPLILTLIAPLTASHAADTTRFIDEAAISHVLDEAANEGFEGVVGISDKNGTFFMRAYGDAVKGATPYSEDTLVDIASITKQFTGAAILKLREQGKLKLDDRLDKYFNNLPDDKKAITLHQLLTHTAGMPDLIGRDEEPLSREAYLKRAFGAPLVHTPGTVHSYSNVGYSVLGAVIEIASSEPYETYLFENIWKPAGLFTTGYYRPDWRGYVAPQITEPVAGLLSQKQLLDELHGDNWHLRGNGGLLSTASDMLKWHRALLGTKILNAESKKLLFAPHVSEGQEGFYYGYGWAVEPGYAGGPLIWHNGGSYFSRAEFWRFPESGFGIFIATHKRTAGPNVIADSLARILSGISPDPENK